MASPGKGCYAEGGTPVAPRTTRRKEKSLFLKFALELTGGRGGVRVIRLPKGESSKETKLRGRGCSIIERSLERVVGTGNSQYKSVIEIRAEWGGTSSIPALEAGES